MYYDDNRNDQAFKEAQQAYDYAQEPDDDINTDGTPHMVCPYCGDVDIDDWEIVNDGGSVECISCGRTFEYERITQVTYSTNEPGESFMDYITGDKK